MVIFVFAFPITLCVQTYAINAWYHGLLDGTRWHSKSDFSLPGFCKGQLLVHMPYFGSTQEIVCRGSHPVARSFNATLTRLMFPLSDTWGISFGANSVTCYPAPCWKEHCHVGTGLCHSQPLYLEIVPLSTTYARTWLGWSLRQGHVHQKLFIGTMTKVVWPCL